METIKGKCPRRVYQIETQDRSMEEMLELIKKMKRDIVKAMAVPREFLKK